MEKEENRGATVEEAVKLWKQEIIMNQKIGNSTSGKTVEEIVNDLVSKKLLTEDEKDKILGNEDKSIIAEYEIKIGSRTIFFHTRDLRTGAPGLYKTRSNVLLKPWEELLSENIITVSNNRISKCSTDIAGDLVIMDGITHIGASVFNSCTKLTEIILPDSICWIGQKAFEGCIGLTEITIPKNVGRLGESQGRAFADCIGLKKVVIQSLNISDMYGVNNNFEGCVNLEELIYDEGVIKINAIGCTGVKKVVISSTATHIGMSAFKGYTNLTEITIPESVAWIGHRAFEGCTGLTEITIPKNVGRLGENQGRAFADCTELRKIIIEGSNVYNYGSNNNFEGCTKLEELIYEEGVTKINNIGCKEVTKVSIPSTITHINDSAFRGYINLTEITISESVAWIGKNAFEGCTRLTEIRIPEKVKTIGTDAFKDVAHIYYSGTATGSPWGALAIN